MVCYRIRRNLHIDINIELNLKVVLMYVSFCPFPKRVQREPFFSSLPYAAHVASVPFAKLYLKNTVNNSKHGRSNHRHAVAKICWCHTGPGGSTCGSCFFFSPSAKAAVKRWDDVAVASRLRKMAEQAQTATTLHML